MSGGVSKLLASSYRPDVTARTPEETVEKLWLVALAVFVLNLPFGYWRSRVRKKSPQWFLAIHAPIPGVIALRLMSGLGFRLVTFPVIVGAFFLGQLVGGKIGGRAVE